MPIMNDPKRPLQTSAGSPYLRRSDDFVNAVTGLFLPPKPRAHKANEHNYEFPGDLSYLRYQGRQ